MREGRGEEFVNGTDQIGNGGFHGSYSLFEGGGFVLVFCGEGGMGDRGNGVGGLRFGGGGFDAMEACFGGGRGGSGESRKERFVIGYALIWRLAAVVSVGTSGCFAVEFI